jgi:Zn-dependent peptidase ImmA (M78 family)/transcriptional regulator with XRE-family HTH domain
MNNLKKDVIPYRIKQGRVSRGFSMAELADLVGVSKQAISQYETGRNEPTNATLNQISSILRYPVSYFRKPMPKIDTASSGVFFRSKKTSKIKDKNAAMEKINIFSEIHEYLNAFIEFPEVNFPKIEYNNDGENGIDNNTIEMYAQQLRTCWSLGNGPIDSLINVAQKNGIIISSMSLRLAKLEAFSVWNNIPYIFVNSDKDSNARIRFSIAHEIGHLIMHADNYTEEELKKEEIYNMTEDEANRFAGALLLPAETFSKDIYSSSIDHFIQLKAKWKVSIAAMIMRCEVLGLLTQNQIKYLKDQMTKRVYWRTEPLDNTTPVERPYAHKQAVKLLLENDIISPSKFIEDTGCLKEELEEYCFLDKGMLDIKEDSNVIQLRRVQ